MFSKRWISENKHTVPAPLTPRVRSRPAPNGDGPPHWMSSETDIDEIRVTMYWTEERIGLKITLIISKLTRITCVRKTYYSQVFFKTTCTLIILTIQIQRFNVYIVYRVKIQNKMLVIDTKNRTVYIHKIIYLQFYACFAFIHNNKLYSGHVSNTHPGSFWCRNSGWSSIWGTYSDVQMWSPPRSYPRKIFSRILMKA